ncbi:hypothetical protein AX15_003933 [Amanita polypyramis BW_CC]|nr:hypothetical protein AX15_003933 [Amanita polypyramis BW_CC]
MVTSPSLQMDTANSSAKDVANQTGLWQSPSLSKSVPVVRISSSPSDERPSFNLNHAPSKANKKARIESMKLLAHVLVQLQTRHMPPTVYDSFGDKKNTTSGSSIGVMVDTMKDAIKRKGASVVGSPSQIVDDDSDEDTRLVYSTDDTYELLIQLRNVLLLSVAQGWQIFDDELDAEGSKSSHPFRRTRSSFQGNRSGSPSPVRGSHIHASELLMQCVSVLASIVQEDCRYKTAAPRPLRPSNSLHALCLDIAQFLINTNRRNPQVVSHIAHVMIPSFSTFPKEMHVKLLKFFEECILWGVYQDLHTFQSGIGQGTPKEIDKTGGEKAHVTIQIDGVDEVFDHDHDSKYDWDSSTPFGSTILSANAPSQARSVYHLSSIASLLLAAILENVDIDKDHHHLELHERFQRVLLAIMRLKFDACSDLLRVIAYHTPQARPSACAALILLWRTAVGHITVSEPLAGSQIRYPPNTMQALSHPYSHRFIPWRFAPASCPVRNSCHSCANLIVGFGLMCPSCMCNVHFDCYDYPQGCSLVQYIVATDHEIQKVAMYRFCHNGEIPRVPRVQHHDFHCLNLFTLSLCFECRKPLWGCSSQAIGCTSCSIFFHLDCFSAAMPDLPACGKCVIDSGHVEVSKEVLHGTFTDYYSHAPSVNKGDFEYCSYEEISIYLGIFWTQLQILENGIALGSVVVTQDGRNVAQISQVDEFELHLIVQKCQTLLESDNLRSSQLTDDYQFENRLSRREHNLLFDWSCLAFICMVIRGPTRSMQLESPGFLNATNLGALNEHISPEDMLYCAVSSGHMRRALGNEFNIVSEPAVRHFLEYLSQLGFFQTVDNPNGNSQPLSAFTLPFGFDSSVEVETLVSAIEACLSDENLSINEVGFLLLTRRLLPNGMSSEYALRRLARCLIGWILTEDIAVASILRDFVAKQRTLPGVPMVRELLAWPERLSPRTAASSTTNGGDYIVFRRALHLRYSAVWLFSLHDQDPVLYAEMLYDACADFVDEESLEEYMDPPILSPDKFESHRLQKILRCISKLLQASVMFSAFDRLISRWMESAASLKSKEFMAPLYRVFELERNNMFRFSRSSDSAMADFENPEYPSVDPWRPILALASQRGEQLSGSLDWLNLLASGGVQIPTPHFLRFVALISEEKVLKNGVALVNAAFKNTWLNPIGRQDLLLVITKLHTNFSPIIVSAIRDHRNLDNLLQLIRQSLASCLLLFGCDKKKLVDLGIVTDDETRALPHRRKTNNRHSSSRDPATIDANMANAIEQYVDMDVDEISCVIAKFFNVFLTESPLMEAYEVDNFILRNGKMLAKRLESAESYPSW